MNTEDVNQKNNYYDGIIIYLDHNIYARIVTPESEIDKAFYQLLLELKSYEKILIPYSHTHVNEVTEIYGNERNNFIKRHLEVIKELSNSFILEYSEYVSDFIIHKRDPFELFETISNSLDALNSIDDLFHNVKEQLKNPEFRKSVEEKGINVSQIEDFDIQLIKPFLDPNFIYSIMPDNTSTIDAFDIDRKVINGLSPEDAIVYIDKKLAIKHKILLEMDDYKLKYEESFGNLEPLSFIKLLEHFFKVSNYKINEYLKNACFSQLLESFGYKSNSPKFNKNAFYDHCHFSFSKKAHYFICEDKKLRIKLGAHQENKTINGNWVFTREEFINYYNKYATAHNKA